MSPKPTKPASTSPAKVQTPRQYLAQAAIWSAGINLFMNLLAGWLIYRKISLIPLEGETSLRGDSTAMVFIIIFLSLVLSVSGVKKQLRAGLLLPSKRPLRVPAVLRWLLASGLPLGLWMAFLGVFSLVPLVIAALGWLHVESMALWPFLVFKSLLAALTAATFVPFGEWLVILVESGRK